MSPLYLNESLYSNKDYGLRYIYKLQTQEFSHGQ